MSEEPLDLPEAEAPQERDSKLPFSLEAEQSVLGGLMRDASHFDSVLEVVNEDDFFKQNHRLVFQCMKALVEAEQPLDVITISEALSQRDELELVGGLPYLSDLATNVPASENVVAYASIVRENATFRQIISTATEISRASFNPGGLSSEDLLSLAERRFLEVSEGRPKEGGFAYVNELLKESLEKIDERYKNRADITGLATGLNDLNEKTSGWQPGDLIILAARPSMGKTALALNFVESALMTQEKPVLVFSLEMPADSLVMRMMSAIGRIDQGGMRSGRLNEDDWPKLDLAVRKLKDKKLFIDDTPGLSPSEMKARTRRVAREHGNPAMIMVDYLQLMSISGFTEGRTQEISEISRAMKALARDFKCPVICLSQLNRGVEQRPNKRPMSSDLRESGAIEQDADVIMFIYRDEYYNEDSPDKGVAEIIIGKQRNGETGTVKAAWVGKYTRFENLSMEYQGAEP
ncbi:replicative DNA helicase [Agaribacterium haliotis]|uniref:replicative DNA helicase n=1 Tax=Agaribacterium haliotis TaxID=2013869 RepID=UPI000BB57749|nr:replicative DNA helicase [Agaribacterium haliotis]